MSLHQKLVVVDGLIVANWGRPVFEAMKAGGVTAANCTCCIWEDLPVTMRAVADWKQWFRDHADLIRPVRSVADIHAAKREGRVGVILGWQNSTGFGDYLPMVDVYKELGLGVVQLTYNTANTVGSGCYESEDRGLTDFGRQLVSEMNRVGILIDLSHVGGRTASDTIRASQQPVAYTHCLPAALKAHPRNKTDAQLREMAEKGGFVGVTMFPPFLQRGAASTLDDCVDAIEHVLNVVGEEQVGIGSDFTQGHGDEFMRYITADKGYARRLTEFGEVIMPAGFQKIEDYPNLTATLEQRGWKEPRIRRVMGENWVRMLTAVWGSR